MRTPAPGDFPVDVEGVGSFVFGRRTLRDELRISAEIARTNEGVDTNNAQPGTPEYFLAQVGGWMAVLRVLTVNAPAEWDLDTMDPLDETTYQKLALAHAALREKEGSFRRGAKP